MMNTIHGRIYYDHAYRVMVGLVGPKWIKFCYFADGGRLKIRKAPAKEARYITAIRDNRDNTTAEALARRFLWGRRKGMNKEVRRFLDRVLEEAI